MCDQMQRVEGFQTAVRELGDSQGCVLLGCLTGRPPLTAGPCEEACPPVPAAAMFLRASHVPLPTLCLGLPMRPQSAGNRVKLNKSSLKRTLLRWVNVSACREEPEDALKRKETFSVEMCLLLVRKL